MQEPDGASVGAGCIGDQRGDAAAEPSLKAAGDWHTAQAVD